MLLGMRRGRLNAVSGWLVLGGLVTAVLTATIVLALRDLGRSSQVADVVGTILSAVSLLIAFFSWRSRRSDRVVVDVAGPDFAEHRANRLAQQLQTPWLVESKVKGLDREVLRVRWAARSDLEDHPEHVYGEGRRDVPKTGLANNLFEVFADLSGERLVIVGDIGSGKSTAILQLGIELLKRRTAGQRVPVIVSVSSWDPGSQSLREWMVQRLGEDYHNGDSEIPEILLEHGLLLPILDGLDEMSERQRSLAIENVGGLRTLPAFVLTCRTDEYAQTVAASAEHLTGARVVELEPIKPDEAAEYLRLMAKKGTARWTEVLEALRADRRGVTPLGSALKTPLMAFLASTTYRKENDPRELLDHAKFATANSIEQHLFEELLPVLYDPALKSTDSPKRWTALRVRPWFEFLAKHLQTAESTDFAWWTLIDRVPRSMRIVLSTLAFSAFFACMAAILVTPISLLRNGPTPGLLIGVLYVLSGTLPAGFGYAIGAELIPPPVPSKTRLGISLRAPNLVSLSVAGFCFGLAGLALGDLWLAGLFAVMGALIVIVWNAMESPLDASELVDSSDTFGQDTAVVRMRSVVFWPAIMTVAFFMTSFHDAIIAGVATGAAGGFIGGMGTKAWGRFTVAQHWFTARGRLPWRTKLFLEDAVKRDALRKAGSMYQFRHRAVQEYLAEATDLQR